MVIIGINHIFQHRGPGHQPELADRLESTVRDVAREFDDAVGAEEYSEDLIERVGEGGNPGQPVSLGDGIRIGEAT